MASIKSKGINYFNIECVQDDKLEFILAKHKAEGYGIVVQLWRRIFAVEGYYCPWTEKNIYLFAKDNGVEVDTVNAVIQTCFEEHIFNLQMFESYGILTSRGIQKRWIKIVTEAKRKDKEMEPNFNLLAKTPEKSTKTPEETQETPVIDIQSKVKESKVKESKEEERERGTFVPPAPPDVFEFFKGKKSDTKWTDEKCKTESEKFVSYYKSSGWKIGKKPMTDWQASAEKWILTDQEFAGRTPQKNVAATAGPPVGRSQVSEPSKEPSPEQKIQIAKNSVITSYNEFCRKGYYEDFANTVYKALLFLEVQQFMSFIEGKYDYFTEKGAAKFRSKPAQEIDMKNGIMRTMEENSLRGANEDERHVAEGKKEAVKEFFHHLQELEISIENIF